MYLTGSDYIDGDGNCRAESGSNLFMFQRLRKTSGCGHWAVQSEMRRDRAHSANSWEKDPLDSVNVAAADCTRVQRRGAL